MQALALVKLNQKARVHIHALYKHIYEVNYRSKLISPRLFGHSPASPPASHSHQPPRLMLINQKVSLELRRRREMILLAYLSRPLALFAGDPRSKTQVCDAVVFVVVAS
jgi:hypothetical protein